MKLNYPYTRFDKIPEEVEKISTEELDLTDDIHQLEMDRRLYIKTFLRPYDTETGEWIGYPGYWEESDDQNVKEPTLSNYL